MQAVVPITITTPDGVERTLRATQGARRRIFEKYRADLQTVLNERGDAALPDILYALMHDTKGKPPADLTVEELAEMLPLDSGPALMAAVLSAFSQGKLDPNDAEAAVKQIIEIQRGMSSTSGLSATNASGLPTETSSGGDTSNANSTPSPEQPEPLSDAEPN